MPSTPPPPPSKMPCPVCSRGNDARRFPCAFCGGKGMVPVDPSAGRTRLGTPRGATPHRPLRVVEAPSSASPPPPPPPRAYPAAEGRGAPWRPRTDRELEIADYNLERGIGIGTVAERRRTVIAALVAFAAGIVLRRSKR